MNTPLHIGTRKGLFTFTHTGGQWHIARTSFLGVQVPIVMHDPRDGTLYAAVEHGHFGTKLHASRDGGATWEERATPAYPPKPDDVPDIVCPMRQKAIPWSLEKIWSLEPGGPSEPGTLWCGTIPGGLFKSTDHGATWQLLRSLWDSPRRAKWFGGGYDYPGIHSICVDPRDPRHVTIAISCGGVWATRDGGDTWEVLGHGLVNDYMPPDQAGDPDTQDPHRIVACPAAPDTLWMQHHNGIFHSSDAGRNWTRIEHAGPSVFGFAVAVHPADPRRAWFIPGVKDEARYAAGAALCVTETRDNGATFTAHRAGLPQQHAYHICYRHCLDITPASPDPAHVTLAFGSTTGSLWASSDSGENWQRLTAELPPIYCVRFGIPG